MTDSFAELLCRTHYSFLRGASSPTELVERAAQLGLAALAITDRDGVYGIPKAYRAVCNHPSLKLIVGAELTWEDGSHLALLASDRAAYGVLCRLLTASHRGRGKPRASVRGGTLRGQEKGRASIRKEDFLQIMDTPGSKGLIGIFNLSLEEDHDYSFFKEVFSENIYLSLSRSLDGLDAERTEKALQLSRAFDLPIVASNDVHFHQPQRKPLHDVLVSTREGVPLSRVGTRIFPNAEKYLKSPRQMAALFRDLPEAIENTLKIADQCHFSPRELRYYYPSEWIPAGETAQSYLENLTWKGAQWRYLGDIPNDVVRQLEHELKLIHELRFADYFLTIWEIVEFAKKRQILCQGRGSAANSAVCYCLGITAIDPVRMNLLFERFISVERGEPPDIDVDFEHERREEVIQHIYEKYGRDRAGMVSAVITYRSRSAIRDVARALEEDPEELREKSVVQKLPEKIEKLKDEIYGFPRHLSIHSGGFTLSASPLIETVPIEPARMEGRTIVQWDKEDLETIGLLKVDILALGMLTAIRKTMDLVRCERGQDLTLATIPPDDGPTYEMIRRADTVGVFQIESRAQMNMLQRLLPKNFYDLVIQVAIVRPGPIQGQMVHPYLRRRRGLEDSRSPDPRMEPILSRTLGVPLFQEQVMKIAIVMAGFSPGEADELRRAIGAWRSTGSIKKMGARLKEGLLANGLPPEFVDRLFRQIQGFAEYGFPESHAASFALLAYASSYLKCHFPAEFCCALLNSLPMGFYSSHTLVEDAKRHGVEVLGVHPNYSDWDCTMEKGALRLGWRIVQGMVKSEAEILIRERKQRPFQSLKEFLSRVSLQSPVLNRLAIGDAFQCFGLSQREALWELLSIRVIHRPSELGLHQQLNLFSYQGEGDPGLEGRDMLLRAARGGQSVEFEPLSLDQAIQADYETYHLSVRGHPMAGLRNDPLLRRKLPAGTTASIKQMKGGLSVRLAGLIIVRQRPPTAKGTAFATLEDEWGFADLVFHQEIYERFQDELDREPFVVVTAKVQRDGALVSLLVKQVKGLFG